MHSLKGWEVIRIEFGKYRVLVLFQKLEGSLYIVSTIEGSFYNISKLEGCLCKLKKYING